MVKSTLVGFTPGNIISDAVFTNKNTMTEAQIQAFFNSKVSRCLGGRDENNEPIVCLKDFRMNTVTRPADAYCSGYSGAANESAARIIYRVSQACNINPQVLIVMLQKEQSLVTHTWPSAWRFRIALGQGCPDTAPCDPKFIGFFHQIYGAARQMQIYMEGKWFQWYAPGKTWNILYNPNKSCGSSPVYIANKATSALYYYTPYQPNAAAIRAGYGDGDGCSAHGNRNFYNYFTDWFGPTSYNLRPAVLAEWQRLGGAAGPLGAPVGNEVAVAANGGGYVQAFRGGTIWLRTGATVAYGAGAGPFRDSYLAAGGPSGSWGWPTGAPYCGLVDGGCLMDVQNGTVGYSASTGGVLIPSSIAKEWNRVGATPMGFPLAPAYCGMVDSGCIMSFQRATVGFSPATGASVIWPAAAAEWNRLGAAVMGYPTAPATALGSGEQQQFSRSTVWSVGGKGYAVGSGPFRDSYVAAGGPTGAWGWPTAAPYCGLVGGGCLMDVQNGTVGYSSATGSVLIPIPVAKEWNRIGATVLGYPQSAAVTTAAGVTQTFTLGTVVSTTQLTQTIPKGTFLTRYLAAGGPTGAWGWPTAALYCGLVDSGCMLQSQNGTLASSSATALVMMPPQIALEWNLRGVRVLGYPTAPAQTSGTVTTQRFQKGTVSHDSATGKTSVS